MDSVTSLYNHMEEQVHILVHNSNVSLEHLEYLKQLRGMEDHFTQVRDCTLLKNREGEKKKRFLVYLIFFEVFFFDY